MDIDGIWMIAGMSFLAGILAVFIFAGIAIRIIRSLLTNPVVVALLSAIAGFRAAGGGSRQT